MFRINDKIQRLTISVILIVNPQFVICTYKHLFKIMAFNYGRK